MSVTRAPSHTPTAGMVCHTPPPQFTFLPVAFIDVATTDLEDTMDADTIAEVGATAVERSAVESVVESVVDTVEVIGGRTGQGDIIEATVGRSDAGIEGTGEGK